MQALITRMAFVILEELSSLDEMEPKSMHDDESQQYGCVSFLYVPASLLLQLGKGPQVPLIMETLESSQEGLIDVCSACFPDPMEPGWSPQACAKPSRLLNCSRNTPCQYHRWQF